MKIFFSTLVNLCKFIDPTSIDKFSVDFTKIEKTDKFNAKLTLNSIYDLEFENPADETFFLLRFNDILDKNILR